MEYKMLTLTDEEFVNAVYQWNLLFYDGAMKATKASSDIKKYKYLVKKEDVIKDTIYSYLTYWRKVNPTANPLVYVIDCTRNFMENLKPPKKKEITRYNNIPLLYN
jgi:hypothetical protein